MKQTPILPLIFGFSSLLGLILNISYIVYAYKSDQVITSTELIFTLSVTVIILSLTFVFFSLYYLNRLARLANMDIENNSFKEIIRNKELIIKNSSEYIYEIGYYHQKILNTFDEFIYNHSDKYNQKDFDKITKQFTDFLTIFSANIQSFTSLLSNDKCSVTVKIVKGKKIKTFWRDSLSHRKRKKSDIDRDGNDFIYDIEDNFAFKAIMSKDIKETYYLNEDLINDKDYFNRNILWKELYNATTVVPISTSIGDYRTAMHGFLCVDNFNGKLNDMAIHGLLYGSAHLLYSLFCKFEIITNIANINNYHNEQTKRFTNWDNN